MHHFQAGSIQKDKSLPQQKSINELLTDEVKEAYHTNAM